MKWCTVVKNSWLRIHCSWHGQQVADPTKGLAVVPPSFPTQVSSHETWTIPNRSKDWLIANYLNHDAFSNTRFVTPSRKNAAKTIVLLNIAQQVDWILVFLNGWMNHKILQAQDMLFFFPKYTNAMPKAEEWKSNQRCSLSSLFFAYAIFHWQHDVFQQIGAQTH